MAQYLIYDPPHGKRAPYIVALVSDGELIEAFGAHDLAEAERKIDEEIAKAKAARAKLRDETKHAPRGRRKRVLKPRGPFSTT